MLNLRNIDKQFILSGGWENIFEDMPLLANTKVQAILDLQFAVFDNLDILAERIKDVAAEHNMEYAYIPMNDGEMPDVVKRWDKAYGILDGWASYLDGKILIKCGAGVSRSVSTLAYYYCRRDQISYIEARDRIQAKDIDSSKVMVDVFFETKLKEMFPYDWGIDE